MGHEIDFFPMNPSSLVRDKAPARLRPVDVHKRAYTQ